MDYSPKNRIDRLNQHLHAKPEKDYKMDLSFWQCLWGYNPEVAAEIEKENKRKNTPEPEA